MKRAGKLVVVVNARTGAVTLRPAAKGGYLDPTRAPRRTPALVKRLLELHLYDSREDPPTGSTALFKLWAEVQGVPTNDIYLFLGNAVDAKTVGAVRVEGVIARGFAPVPDSASNRVALEVALYQRKLNNKLHMLVERARSPTAFMG